MGKQGKFSRYAVEAGKCLLIVLALGACTKSKSIDAELLAPNPATAGSRLPPPVIVNEQGQMIDKEGNVLPESEVRKVRPYVYVPVPPRAAKRTYVGGGQ